MVQQESCSLVEAVRQLHKNPMLMPLDLNREKKRNFQSGRRRLERFVEEEARDWALHREMTFENIV